MSEWIRTGCYVLVACAAAALVWFTGPSDTPNEGGVAAAIGGELAPDFDDPADVTSLTVRAFDEETASVRSFAVEKAGPGRWRIASHFGYPLNSGERLAETAAGLIGLTRGALVTRRSADHERYGVLDPLDEAATSLEGRGHRITLEGEDDKTLLDIIVGDAPDDRPGFRYVREPKEDAVYLTRFGLDLSLRFRDWIDPHLLALDPEDLLEVFLLQYSIPEQSGGRVAFTDFDVLRLTRAETADPWNLQAVPQNSAELSDSNRVLLARYDDWTTLAAGEEVPAGLKRRLFGSLRRLDIEAVRRKPDVLTPELAVDRQKLPTDPNRANLILNAMEVDFRRKGFELFSLGRGAGRLVATHGQVFVKTRLGVTLGLAFGDTFTGTVRTIELGDEAEPDTTDTADAETETYRYLFVTARFDESLLGTPPTMPDLDALPEEARESVAAAHRESVRLYEQTRKEGQQLAAELQAKTDPWYFVVSESTYRSLRASSTELSAEIDEAKRAAAESDQAPMTDPAPMTEVTPNSPREPLSAPRP